MTHREIGAFYCAVVLFDVLLLICFRVTHITTPLFLPAIAFGLCLVSGIMYIRAWKNRGK